MFVLQQELDPKSRTECRLPGHCRQNVQAGGVILPIFRFPYSFGRVRLMEVLPTHRLSSQPYYYGGPPNEQEKIKSGFFVQKVLLS